ncbi:phosphotransferase family protein [Virgibacillus necropolis]|uniref:Phosphotransferase n=1 Tax=Virgibacillus necropolis TaxID=163877 RepID=A0A221MBF4_9BACI|nr:phosphotransferase family protein [Virgibacillus necropolis]ASN04942.1 phosphotransferase [Virgibacillus necropolis]
MNVNWLKAVLGKEWDIKSAGGLTGEAYIAEKNDRKLFLKRNSSPFLAVLSAEGIVPKLVWTKRLENGDVITAQEWMVGRELNAIEMQHHEVASLLQKIHHSSELLHMLMRLGKKPFTPKESLHNVKEQIMQNNINELDNEVSFSLNFLEELLPMTENQKQVVCHGDLNHNNILLTGDSHLYLIDWDNAMIADPIIDIGFILKWYIPKEDWDEWLFHYGISRDSNLIKRMYWYLLLDALYYVNWHTDRKEFEKGQERLQDICELNMNIRELLQI